MPRRAVAGFTMIELLIVVVVFTLMAGLAFPSISRITMHARVNQATGLVAHDLSVAVSNAARDRKPVRLARGVDKKSVVVSDRVSGSVLWTRSFGPSDALPLDSVVFSTTPVDILPSGFTSGTLAVRFWAGGYSRQLIMSRAGWVQAP